MKTISHGLRMLAMLPLVLAGWPTISSAANPVYVGASFGLYRSTDAGATWSRVEIPLNNSLLKGNIIVTAVSIDPHNPSKLYCIGNATARAFFATADAGKTWSAIPFVGMYGRDVGVDVAGQVVYITATTSSGSGDNLLYKTTNSGTSWTRLKVPSTKTPPGPNGAPLRFFAPDTTTSGTVYAVTDLDEFFKSTDFGETWTFVAKQITLTSGSVAPQTLNLSIHQDPRNPKIWYNATDHSSFPETCPVTNGGMCGLFKSTDGGTTFTGLSLPSGYVSGVAIGAPSGTVYATADVGGLGGAVMKTTDGGDTWTPIQTGMFTPQSGRVWADPTDPSLVFVNDSFTNHSFNVSTDGGATFSPSVLPQGPPGCVPGNCERQEVHDLAIAPSTQPTISAVVNAASLQAPIVPNSWVTIFGTNLAAQTDDWSHAIVGGKFPTSLDGVSVSIGGKPAYIYFITPGQINVLAPDVNPGAVQVTVTNASGTSAPFTVTASQYGPAIFEWPGKQPVATRQDFTYAVKAGTFAGANTVAAKPGDVIILWGTGFGPTNPAAPIGVAVPGDKAYSTPTLPTVTINNTAVKVYGAALASGAAGLYQIAIQVPATMADGDWPIQAAIGGALSPTGVLLTVQH